MIEARSLSALTALADDPPLHLSSATELPREPLVLYIARVPGSQDVFLTPLKPRDRVVSDTDVASSLYYCHVDAAADVSKREILLEAAGASAEPSTVNGDPDGSPHASSRGDGSESPLPQSSRSLLPEAIPPLSPNPSLDQSPIPYPHPRRPQSPARPSIEIARKPVGSGASPSQSHGASTWHSRSPAPRKTLGPRPMLAPPSAARHSTDASAWPPSTPLGSRTPDARRWSEAPSLRGGACSLSSLDGENRPNRDDREDADHSAPTVTLIRRDPGSGAQWNVGRIALIPSTEAGKGRAAGAALQIDTAGYAKFVAASDIRPDLDQASQHTEHSRKERPAFLRRLSLQPPGLSSQKRRSFHAGVDSMKKPSRLDATPQSFSFESPWAGTCAFTTSVAGKALRCRHHHSERPGVVSELRPNLPGTGLLPPSSPNRRSPFSKSSPSFPPERPLSAALASENRSSYFDMNTPDVGTGAADAMEDAEEVLMDYSLGRERAGGGLRGRTAKLGKLIIEGEGMAMLDLVVGANMAVWWSLATRRQ